jgi:two-component system, chemotaxis family, chemotaxis protein CheY
MYNSTGSAASVLSPPIRLLPQGENIGRDSNQTWTMLLDRMSPFGSPSMRTTAQAAGVLIIDDDPQIRSIVARMLMFEGYVVWRAGNGMEALAVLDHARPALALLDMRMPGLDGWGFARAVEERRVALPVLVMTAAPDGERWAHEIGAAGWVSKPFVFMDLLTAVERVVAPR